MQEHSRSETIAAISHPFLDAGWICMYASGQHMIATVTPDVGCGMGSRRRARS